MKKFFVFLFTLFFMTISSCFAEDVSVLGDALSVTSEEVILGDVLHVKQTVDVRILNGVDKGELIKVDNVLGGNPYYDINVKQNDKLVLQNSDGEYFISDYYRVNVLILLSIIFTSLLILVGKKKGINSLLAILVTVGLIYFMLRPLILIGISPLFGALLVSLFSTIITMYFVGGVNKKSTSAVLGTISSLVLASILALIVIRSAKLTGFADETSLYLYSSHPELDFSSITASMIILVALGAVMDVAMSIASTINEIHKSNKNMSSRKLFRAGMNVGKDIIGTMANTLILVYMGGALPLILLFSGIDVIKFFNLNAVVTEIASALIGSTALLICVPITAFITANFIRFADEKAVNRDIIDENY